MASRLKPGAVCFPIHREHDDWIAVWMIWRSFIPYCESRGLLALEGPCQRVEVGRTVFYEFPIGDIYT